MPLIVAWEPGNRLSCSPTAGSAIAVSLLLNFAMSSAAGTLHSLADLLPGIVENAAYSGVEFLKADGSLLFEWCV